LSKAKGHLLLRGNEHYIRTRKREGDHHMNEKKARGELLKSKQTKKHYGPKRGKGKKRKKNGVGRTSYRGGPTESAEKTRNMTRKKSSVASAVP